MRNITITGNVGRDVEVNTSAAGNEFGKTSVGVSVYDKKEESGYRTDWYNIVAFGKNAERLFEKAAKGTKILVQGELSLDTYTNKDGVEKVSPTIAVQHFEVFPKGE